MVGLGLLMIFAGLWSAYLRRKGSLYSNKHFLRFVLLLGPAGLLATLAGWFTTELGRQPWVIQGLMRTQDAVSSHSVTHLSISLGIFIVSYCGIFGVGYSYMMRLIRKGPDIAATSH